MGQLNEDPTQLLIGIGKHIDGKDKAVILYIDPVLDEWVIWGNDPDMFEMQLLKDMNLTIDLYRQYLPYQLPLLNGFRKNKEFINKIEMFDNGSTRIIVQMLRDSGYTLLPDRQPDNITVTQLDAALKERPDLYLRREMKEV